MAALTRSIIGLAAALACLGASPTAAAAAARTKPAPVHPTPPAVAHKKPAPSAPLVFQLSPARVDPSRQPNIMIIGQYLSPSTRVMVGGRPAVTVESPDNQTLLVKLPEALAKGSYEVDVTNEAGTAVADDQLVVDDSQAGPSTLTTMAGAGFLLLLLLVMRLARTPGLA
ncbi:MAG TPA: IPT/TIG domain-containing protein [Candidatus Dormibacteraeota bacterium]|nr:IPT/TIG domain-containing protein [Candidatus Dormibacteraeota bacterium]